MDFFILFIRLHLLCFDAAFEVTLEVRGLAHLYFPYKCSTKSSFVWFGMQWNARLSISNADVCFACVLTRAVRLIEIELQS